MVLRARKVSEAFEKQVSGRGHPYPNRSIMTLCAKHLPVITILLRIVRSMNIGRAGTVYKGLYNWPNETIGKQHKQCP